MTKYKESLKNQLVDPYYQERSTSYMMYASWLVISVLMLSVVTVRSCIKDPEPVAAKKACVTCHNRQMVMTQYFKRNGSKTPEEMAYAVLSTKSPRLLAAVAKVESGGNHTIRGTGYKKRHHGAFQVNPKHWRTVPTDAVGQSLQAERILEELTEKTNIVEALNAYGGDKTNKKYAATILKELSNVP